MAHLVGRDHAGGDAGLLEPGLDLVRAVDHAVVLTGDQEMVAGLNGAGKTTITERVARGASRVVVCSTPWSWLTRALVSPIDGGSGRYEHGT